ncbi:MAG: protein kinase [Myxococcales bacterium]|nr:protein kinase [Myxococcales bacterium]
MADPARNGELVGKKLGKYELLALIAVGGTAEIYLARISGASGFEKYLVLKCLLAHLADEQEFVSMFLDEARVSAQLDNSNIVQTLELGEHDGRYFLVMEYLAGMSVAQLARKTQEQRINGGLIETNLVLGLASQTCNGLQYAHSKMLQGKSLNLVHRDISPQNLVVGYEGILKIVDFGIAKSSIKEVHTRTGTIKGKFAYMSPEQCLAKEVDHRTDIFALGTLCHELLTGRRLFKRKSTYDTYQAIVNGGVPLPSKLNPRLDSAVDRVIMKALEYKADDRYQSAQEFGESLLSLIHQLGGSAGPGDIARFFDDNFSAELDAHATQMRKLITGSRSEAPEATWDSELDDLVGSPEPAATQRVATEPIVKNSGPLKPPLMPKKRVTAPLASKSPIGVGRNPAPKLGTIPALLPVTPDLDVYADDDDEGPTRIEFTPADRGAAIHEEATGVDGQWEAPTKHSVPPPAAAIAPPQRAQPPQPQAPAPGARPSPPLAAPAQGGQQIRQGTIPRGNMPPVSVMQTPSPVAQMPCGQPGDFSAPPKTINVAQAPAAAANLIPGLQQGQTPEQRATLMGQQSAYVNPQGMNQQHGGPVPVALPHAASAGRLAAPSVLQTPGIAGQAGPPHGQVSNNFLPEGALPSRAVTTFPESNGEGGQDAGPPVWMHGAVFLACVGLGFGVAAFIRLML